MKIAILGYGKMGRTIERVLYDTNHEIILKVDDDSYTDEELANADVAIEFTQPQSAIQNILRCVHNKVPVVVGTTGWHEKLDDVKKACDEKGGAVFYASNFSIGMNMFFALNQFLAKIMHEHPEYEINLEETHHTEKVDAPSGTAITLAEGILAHIGRKGHWINESATGESLGIVSKRVQGVPGTHHVIYESDIDTIEITHTAKNREGFAKGAVTAAEWIIGKQGVFTMNDLLNFDNQ